MRGWTIPRLVETKHIKHEAICASETARFFVVSNIFHQPFGFAPEGFFFLPSGRLVRRLFSFHFPVAGWLRELNKNPKKEPNMANRNTNPGIGENADSGVMHNPQPSRTRTRTRVVSPTGILKESLTVLTRRARVRGRTHARGICGGRLPKCRRAVLARERTYSR